MNLLTKTNWSSVQGGCGCSEHTFHVTSDSEPVLTHNLRLFASYFMDGDAVYYPVEGELFTFGDFTMQVQSLDGGLSYIFSA